MGSSATPSSCDIDHRNSPKRMWADLDAQDLFWVRRLIATHLETSRAWIGGSNGLADVDDRGPPAQFRPLSEIGKLAIRII